jgi:hypothetical protein
LVEPLEGSTECLYNRLPRPYYPHNEVAGFTRKSRTSYTVYATLPG